nr:ABC transporter G family member 6-like [Ipomoea trifida]
MPRRPECGGRVEFALDLIRELEGSPEGTKSLVEFSRRWSGGRNSEPAVHSLSLKEAQRFWREAKMAVLSKRSFTNLRRMPEIIGFRLGIVSITGFILATMFWRFDNSPKGIQERLGFFAFAMSTTFYTCADTLPVFIQERGS